MGSFSKSSLLRKYVLFTAIGLVATLGLFGFWSLHALEESTQEILRERLVIAETMAQHVDQHLQELIPQLEETAQTLAAEQDASPERIKEILSDVDPDSRSHTYGIYLLDRSGAVVFTQSAGLSLSGLKLEEYTYVNDALVKGKPGVSGAMMLPGLEKPGILVTVPIKDSRMLVRGAVVVALNPLSPSILGLVGSTKLGSTGYAQVVDDDGLLIVSTRPDARAREIDHSPRFIELIKTGRKTVVTCHRCHEGGQRQVDVIAFAPLKGAPWGVAIRQAEEEAFALVNDLRWKILLASVISIMILGYLAWAILRNVITPIRLLTLAAQRITSGDFAGSIPRVGSDEIGMLAQGLEAMRRSLNSSREEMARRNLDLQAKTDELQRKEDQRRQLLDKVIQAQEEERKRISRELHDEIGQTLTALVMSLGAVEQMLPEDAEAVKEKVGDIRSLTADALQETRRLMLDLRPTLLDDLGLLPAISWYAETHLARAGVNQRISADGLTRLSPQIETVLFRVVQEAITNAVKHAGAKEMHISLEAQGSIVKALVEDDGRGFDVLRDGQKGLGLLGMEERVRLLGGVFHVDSEPGKGTRIALEIPLG